VQGRACQEKQKKKEGRGTNASLFDDRKKRGERDIDSAPYHFFPVRIQAGGEGGIRSFPHLSPDAKPGGPASTDLIYSLLHIGGRAPPAGKEGKGRRTPRPAILLSKAFGGGLFPISSLSNLGQKRRLGAFRRKKREKKKMRENLE